tara:strand:- start:350 stop:1531 length:1182 start_codon:yes stop_codon:yes gene_type:complete
MNRARAKAKARKVSRKTTSRKTRPSQRRNTRPKAKAAPTKTVAKKTESSAPKSRQQKMRDAARKRNENFKKTGVQTHGGTRRNYTKREATKIEKALGRGSFSRVTGGARNPLGDRQAVQNAVNMQENAAFGPLADGAQYAQNITNYGMRFGKTPEARAKAYEQSLDPNSFKGLSDGMTFGSGPVASGDAYARGLNADLNNTENRLRAGRNILSRLTMGAVPSVRRLTDKEIADRRVSINRGPKGGARFNSALAKQQDRPKTMQMGGDRQLLDVKPNTNPALGAVVEKPAEKPVEDTTVNTSREDLNDVTRAAYDQAMSDYGSTTSGSGSTTTPTGPMGSIAGAMGMLAGFAGNRGRKRFRYGRKRGGDRMLSRGSQRFDAMKLPTFTFKGLNI